MSGYPKKRPLSFPSILGFILLITAGSSKCSSLIHEGEWGISHILSAVWEYLYDLTVQLMFDVVPGIIHPLHEAARIILHSEPASEEAEIVKDGLLGLLLHGNREIVVEKPEFFVSLGKDAVMGDAEVDFFAAKEDFRKAMERDEEEAEESNEEEAEEEEEEPHRRPKKIHKKKKTRVAKPTTKKPKASVEETEREDSEGVDEDDGDTEESGEGEESHGSEEEDEKEEIEESGEKNEGDESDEAGEESKVEAAPVKSTTETGPVAGESSTKTPIVGGNRGTSTAKPKKRRAISKNVSHRKLKITRKTTAADEETSSTIPMEAGDGSSETTVSPGPVGLESSVPKAGAALDTVTSPTLAESGGEDALATPSEDGGKVSSTQSQ